MITFTPTQVSTQITYRLATLADIEALTGLMEVSVRTLGLARYSTEQLESGLRWIFGVDTVLIEDGTYFVAEVDDMLVGCGGWSYRKKLFGGDTPMEARGDENAVRDPAVDAAMIRAFFVHPDYARRGIGREILRQSEAAAVAAGFSRLEAAATKTGIPLYAACGYVVCEPIDLVTPDGVPFSGARMEKRV